MKEEHAFTLFKQLFKVESLSFMLNVYSRDDDEQCDGITYSKVMC